ncbi:MAG: hypothetical protein IPJ88_16465 [Myxococcales bacterium]|nr:MAG: hypothetical protein IPJ88_16465 [Myxococcales bacterium]
MAISRCLQLNNMSQSQNLVENSIHACADAANAATAGADLSADTLYKIVIKKTLERFLCIDFRFDSEWGIFNTNPLDGSCNWCDGVKEQSLVIDASGAEVQVSGSLAFGSVVELGLGADARGIVIGGQSEASGQWVYFLAADRVGTHDWAALHEAVQSDSIHDFYLIDPAFGAGDISSAEGSLASAALISDKGSREQWLNLIAEANHSSALGSADLIAWNNAITELLAAPNTQSGSVQIEGMRLDWSRIGTVVVVSIVAIGMVAALVLAALPSSVIAGLFAVVVAVSLWIDHLLGFDKDTSEITLAQALSDYLRSEVLALHEDINSYLF